MSINLFLISFWVSICVKNQAVNSPDIKGKKCVWNPTTPLHLLSFLSSTCIHDFLEGQRARVYGGEKKENAMYTIINEIYADSVSVMPFLENQTCFNVWCTCPIWPCWLRYCFTFGVNCINGQSMTFSFRVSTQNLAQGCRTQVHNGPKFKTWTKLWAQH